MKCVDLGTEYCPCELALTGDCLVCNRFRGSGNDGFVRETNGIDGYGEGDCDCDWAGSCPYTVWKQNGGKVTDGRREISARLVKRTDYDEGISVLVFDVGRGFAQKASVPGSFVFLRREGNRFDIPISVLKADEIAGQIHLAVREEGPKSKQLLNRTLPIDDICEGNTGEMLKSVDLYRIRGPYHSGLLGVEVLHPVNCKGKRILFLTKGIGAAPALLAMDRLMKITQVRWLADDTKIDRRLLEEYAAEGMMPSEGFDGVKEAGMGSPDIVVIAGSPYFVEQMCRRARIDYPNAELVVSNNATMCCGEGVCGACTEVAEDGRVIRRCKCGER